jgi:hypothetical protein
MKMSKPQPEERRHQDGSADSLFYTEPAEKPAVVEQETTDYKKRYDDLKRHYDSTVASNKQKELETKAVERVEQTNAPVELPEDLETFKAEYPDLYAKVASVAKLQSAEGDRGLNEKLEAVMKSQATVAQREAKLTLKLSHPDFDKIVADDNFHAWAETQPKEIQKWIYENPDNPALASRAIDFYKLENGITSKPSTTRNSSADIVSTKTTSIDDKQKRIWKESEIQRMTPAQYEKFEDAIDVAVSEGRVLRGQ